MATPTPKPEIQIHQLETAEQDPLAFDKIHHLYETVFAPYTPHIRGYDPSRQSKTAWPEQLASPNASIFYATLSSSREPIGFLFSTPRTFEEIGVELLHVKLAAVLSSSQGLGVFPMLMEEVKKWGVKGGYGALTICTFPNTFDRMFPILCKNGWEVVAWLDEGEKVLMKMEL